MEAFGDRVEWKLPTAVAASIANWIPKRSGSAVKWEDARGRFHTEVAKGPPNHPWEAGLTPGHSLQYTRCSSSSSGVCGLRRIFSHIVSYASSTRAIPSRPGPGFIRSAHAGSASRAEEGGVLLPSETSSNFLEIPEKRAHLKTKGTRKRRNEMQKRHGTKTE